VAFKPTSRTLVRDHPLLISHFTRFIVLGIELKLAFEPAEPY